jgi:hypothetical protein
MDDTITLDIDLIARNAWAEFYSGSIPAETRDLADLNLTADTIETIVRAAFEAGVGMGVYQTIKIVKAKNNG